MKNKLTQISQVLRKNMTPEEKHLWYDFLQKLPIIFHRQKVIGNYVVDFYCRKAKLVIELDGAQHFTEEGHEQDKIRDMFLTEEKGLLVIRFSNSRIKNEFEKVCEEILACIESRTPPQSPECDSSPLKGEA